MCPVVEMVHQAVGHSNKVNKSKCLEVSIGIKENAHRPVLWQYRLTHGYFHLHAPTRCVWECAFFILQVLTSVRCWNRWYDEMSGEREREVANDYLRCSCTFSVEQRKHVAFACWVEGRKGERCRRYLTRHCSRVRCWLFRYKLAHKKSLLQRAKYVRVSL